MNKQAGFTLIEVLIAVSLVGLVLSAAYALYYYGFRSYTIGHQQSHLQREVTTAARVITEELRYALPEGLELLEEPVSGVPNDGYNYISWDEAEASKGALVLIKEGRTQLTDPVVTSFAVRFVVENGQPLANFAIKGTSEEREFSVESEVLLHNVQVGDVSLDDSGIGIRYRNPD